MKATVLAAAVLLAVTPALAQRFSRVDGNKLQGYCMSPKSTTGCDAYLDGVADAIAAGGKAKAEACIPVNVQVSQLRDVVVKYIHDNPQSRQDRAGVLTVRAFASAFPCKG